MQTKLSVEPLRSLLSTKLHVPQPRRALVPRPHLLKQLSAGLGHKLTLVSAPAGFGKTTLVGAWLAALATRQRAKGEGQIGERGSDPLSPPRAAWLSLDANDNEPLRFWSYLLAACRSLDPTLGRSAAALLSGAQQPSWEAALTLLINDLADWGGRGILVLDDLHAIDTPQIHEQLAFLLDYLPPSLHLVIVTRADPPLPLARWRAQHNLCELRSADLRFSQAEARSFFQQADVAAQDEALVARLGERAEGWVTGLHLLALALQDRVGRRAVERLLATFTGSHAHIFAYFSAEVLRALPAAQQDFLLRTSALGRLNGSLCDFVTGRSDSELLLEQIERANLFLQPLDEANEWYRYHALFAEALQHEARRRLGEAQLRELWRRASLWHERRGALAEAIDAALAAGEPDRAAELIERTIAPEIVGNEFHTLRRWLDQLPAQTLRAHPSLGLSYAMAILFTSDRRAPATIALLEEPLGLAEAHWRAERQPEKLGEALAFRAWALSIKGDHRAANSVANQAIGLLRPGPSQGRGLCLGVLSGAALRVGDLHAARHMLTEACAIWRASGNTYGLLATSALLGEVCAAQGELPQAASHYRLVLAEAEQRQINQQQARARRAWALVGLAALALERNDLDEAEQFALRARAIGEQAALEEPQMRGDLLLARVQQARGDFARVRQTLHAVAARPPEPRLLSLLREARAIEVALAIAVGDLASAEHLLAALGQSEAPGRLQQEREALLTARLRLAQGEPAAALRLLEEWAADAQRHGRAQSALEIALLESLAHFALGMQPTARATALAALKQAQAGGYQRLLLDAGPPMAGLLRLVWPDVRATPLAPYVRGLLLALAQSQPDADGAAARDIVEPLSPQEQRVLRLLAVGLSNAQIARELVVSINTVKTQLQSIYRKLNASSRREASALARSLSLC
jgi:LuxR family maltose regulon positive regulatory protein